MSALQEIALPTCTNSPYSLAEKPRYLEFPVGIVEISGPERFAGAARFLEENPWFHAAWVEDGSQHLEVFLKMPGGAEGV